MKYSAKSLAPPRFANKVNTPRHIIEAQRPIKTIDIRFCQRFDLSFLCIASSKYESLAGERSRLILDVHQNSINEW